jgi:hypothetical protein
MSWQMLHLSGYSYLLILLPVIVVSSGVRTFCFVHECTRPERFGYLRRESTVSKVPKTDEYRRMSPDVIARGYRLNANATHTHFNLFEIMTIVCVCFKIELLRVSNSLESNQTPSNSSFDIATNCLYKISVSSVYSEGW